MKNNIPFICSLLFLCGLAYQVSAQDRIYRKYATQQVHQRLLQENPNLEEVRWNVEKNIANTEFSGRSSEHIIPIVFHIIPAKLKEIISPNRVYAQLQQVNLDFASPIVDQQHPAEIVEGFALSKTDFVGIQFCLAENLADTPSLNYVTSNVAEWSTDDHIKSAATGGVDPWDTDKYINVWVTQLTDQVSGYAQMPEGPSSTDGIVIDYRFFCDPADQISPYSQGRTLTHLLGSYLGLHELWNEVNPCQDDYVEDTPVHNAPNYGPTNEYKHVSLCGKDNPTEMSMNFMDNSDDKWTYLFTTGQMRRMNAFISNGGSRHELVNGPSLCAPANLQQITQSKLKNASIRQTPSVTISPNPAREEVKIELEGHAQAVSISIYSTTGQLVYTHSRMALTGQQSLTLDTKEWRTGIYIIHANLDEINQSYRLSIIK